MLSILIADDDALIRAFLVSIVQELPGSIIAEVADGSDAVAAARYERPDLVLMDISMPRMNGFSAAESLLARWPGLPIIMVTSHADDHHRTAAFKLGARGYVSKVRAQIDLIPAIHAVLSGDRFGQGSLN